MATIRTKLKQLRDADVRFISLVDRAATRIPFRVLKRDKESKMGIDLTQVFKSDGTAGKPFISSLVVFAQKDESAGTQVQDAIKKYGFITDRVQKSDEGETLVYAQQDQAGDVQVVRLSDQLLLTVGGLTTPSGWVGELVKKHGFYPDLEMVTDELHGIVADIVTKSDTPIQDAEAALTSYAEYMTQVAVLPANCFKLNDAIAEVVKKCACSEAEKAEDKDDDEKTEAKKADSPYKETKLHSDKVKNGTIKAGETEAERKKRIKDHPPSEMAPVDEEDDQKPPPDVAAKSDILKALKGLEERTTAQFTGLSTKLEAVVAEQVTQKKALDDVAQKADTLGTQLSTTVTASPVPEDRPAPARMRVQKDDDPRTGNFDTAFLRRRRN